jgi:hypothetical protein
MTPRDVRIKVEAMIHLREQEWKFQDTLNGVSIARLSGKLEKSIQCLCAMNGQKYEIPVIKPLDFMITQPEPETKVLSAGDINQQLQQLSIIWGGGK